MAGGVSLVGARRVHDELLSASGGPPMEKARSSWSRREVRLVGHNALTTRPRPHAAATTFA